MAILKFLWTAILGGVVVIAPIGLAAPLRSALGQVMGRPREVGLTVQYDF